jgi:hypothetical protein
MGCHASGASRCRALSAPSLADHTRSCFSFKLRHEDVRWFRKMSDLLQSAILSDGALKLPADLLRSAGAPQSPATNFPIAA